MSPEQVQGRNVDHRTDIFALGVIFYEMLSGQRPFQGATSVDLISSILKDTPSSVTDIRPDLPSQAARLITRCLEKDPVRRFQATLDLGNELEGLKKESEKEAIPSIAVLPLVNMSADPEQEYFCDGIAEDIINGLTHVAGIRVAARTSAFAFKGKEDDMRQIGKKLDVDTLLEGSVRKAGNRIRVTAQLINVADGYHLWSEQYDRQLTDVFAIQDEIAMNIVQALEVELTDKEKRAIEKAATRNIEAYEFYLRGRQFFYMGRQRTLKHAIEMFERAIQKDPDYALAYAGMADCYSWLFMHHEKDRTIVDRATRASQRSLELDPELAEAHATRGLAVSLDERYAEAEQVFEQAIRLNPKLFEAYYFYARSCRVQGKYEKAAELFAKAAEVRPEDYQAMSQLAGTLQTMNRRTESEAARRDALERVQKHLEFNPDDARALYLGAIALLLVGEREQAFEWAQRALSMDSEDSNVLYNVACVYSLAGEIDEGLRYLERSIDAGYRYKDWIERDSDFESIRHHPRYRTLLGKLD
jgi:TolB-like protein/Flp pilus assembly protein TadD